MAAVCPIVNFIDPLLAQELHDPKGCLRPVEGWPAKTPRSVVFASDVEWNATISAVFRRGMVEPVPNEQIKKKQFGAMVPNGAMAVDKVKNGRLL